MKTTSVIIFLLLSLVSGLPAASPLEGNWSVTRTNDEGRARTQKLTVAGDRVTFEVRNAEGELRLIAKSKAQIQKAGPFNSFTLTDIRAGDSESNLEGVEGERAYIFTILEDRLFIATNFDKERENERPSVDVYTRSAVAKKDSAGDAALIGKWDMELNIDDNTVDYGLRFERVDDQLQATLISPRSGEHKFKEVEFKEGQLKMVIVRQNEGRDMTLTYTGKLAEGSLSGKVTADLFADRSPTWKATKSK